MDRAVFEDRLEKARSNLIFRTDLPYRKPNGTLGYRKGWVKPEDSKKLEQHRAAGGKPEEVADIPHEEDLFDNGEGDAWGPQPEPATAPAAETQSETQPETPETQSESAAPVEEPLTAAEVARFKRLIQDSVDAREIPAMKYEYLSKKLYRGVDGEPEAIQYVREFLANESPAPTPPEPAAPQPAPLRIEDYSDKAFIVIGDQAKYGDVVAQAAGKYASTWDPKRGGWVFSKKREDEIRTALAPQLGGARPSASPGPAAPAAPADPMTALRERYRAMKDPAKTHHLMALMDFKGQSTQFLRDYLGKRTATASGTQVASDILAARGIEVPNPSAVQPAPSTVAPIASEVANPKDQNPEPLAPEEQDNGVSDRVELTPDLMGLHDLSVPIAETKFRDYGSWSATGRHIAPRERATVNNAVELLLLKERDDLTQEDVDRIRRFSGFGGVDSEGERGALYDFYTSPPVAKMVWGVLDKTHKVQPRAQILEPACGGGVFFETAPEGLQMDGVEYDPRTAAVAAILQPGAAIHTGSFEQFNLYNDTKYDHVVGNAPFGDRSVQTSFMDLPEEKSLDRYFVRRSLDSLTDGGSMALIVAPGVMANKGSREWRAEILKQGQFMGAVKLPDSSFKHTQTAVSPDVLVFRKYPQEVRDRLAQLEENGMREAGFWHDGWVEGTYFDQKPEHMVGQKGEGNWGRTIATGDASPATLDEMVQRFTPEAELNEDHLAKLQSMTKDTAPAPRNENLMQMTQPEAAAFAAKTLRVGATKMVGDVVYRLNENHRWERLDAGSGLGEKLNAVKAIGDNVRDLRTAMQNGDPVADLQAKARLLLEQYAEKYGVAHTDDGEVKRFLADNARVQGYHEAMATGMDSPVLNKTNIYDQERDLVDGHNPAIAALTAMGRELAATDEESIRRYYPLDADGLIAEMKRHPDVFLTRDGQWQLREDFITGNAWDKIDEMKAAAAAEGDRMKKAKYEYGAAQLEQAIGWVPIEDADFVPQSSWIPVDLINAWVQDDNGMHRSMELIRDPVSGKWEGKGKPMLVRSTGWGARDYYTEGPVDTAVLYFLNGQKQRSSYNDTEKYNRDAIDNFRNWVMNNADARMRMEELYNRTFNTELGVPTKTYAVNIDGWNPEVVLRPHQWQTVHHLYREGKGISALLTGGGKTKAGIALLALLKQEGKVRRPWLQVPNNKVKDWVEDITGKEAEIDADGKVIAKRKPGCMRGWKVGFVDMDAPGMGTLAGRYKKYQELANGDWDLIVMPESAGSEIQLSPEMDETITKEVVDTQMSDGSKRTNRQTEMKKQTLEGKLDSGKTNQTINFEDFGCDSIMVDEFHRMKNLFTSSLSRETGLNDGRRSDRAMSMFKKMEYTRRQHQDKNVFGLTATPLTNSPLEYYNLMQHIAPEELTSRGISNIDQFIRNFAEIVDGEVYDPFTGQLRTGKRLESFRNLRSLQDMFFKYTDMQNDPAKIGLQKPNANNHPNIIPKNEDQTGVMREIRDEMEQWKIDKEADKLDEGDRRNFLTFYSRFRTASLDLELADPARWKGWVNPKLEELAANSYRLFKANGGGQVIFCDRVVSSDGSFNMHDKIKARLVAQGFKPEEIIIVNGVTKSGGKMSDSALEKDTYDAVKAFNSGKFKAIIGTTATLGEGLNLQRNSSGLHHFDIPYRPSDIIQRNGRIDRQGNEQDNVELHTYATAGTTDNYAMNLVMDKENWINKLLNTKSNVFINPESGGIGADPQELLLSLTEEWGDKSKADEMRAKIAEDKEAAIKAKRTAEMSQQLEMLSRARGALKGYEGDRGNLQYQNRLQKITSLEKNLADNPEFLHPDLLTDTPPDFIYTRSDPNVYKIGDVIVNSTGPYQVVKIDHKKQEFQAAFLGVAPSDYQKTLTWSASRGFGSYYSGSADSRPAFYPQPSPDDVRRIKAENIYADFVELSDAEKAQVYPTILRHGKSADNLPTFKVRKDAKGAEKVVPGSARYDYERRDPEVEYINPYSAEGRKRLEDAAARGDFTGYGASTEAAKVLGEDHPAFVEGQRANFRQWSGAQEFERQTAGKDKVYTDELKLPASRSGYGFETELREHPDWKLTREGPRTVIIRKGGAS